MVRVGAHLHVESVLEMKRVRRGHRVEKAGVVHKARLEDEPALAAIAPPSDPVRRRRRHCTQAVRRTG